MPALALRLLLSPLPLLMWKDMCCCGAPLMPAHAASQSPLLLATALANIWNW